MNAANTEQAGAGAAAVAELASHLHRAATLLIADPHRSAAGVRSPSTAALTRALHTAGAPDLADARVLTLIVRQRHLDDIMFRATGANQLAAALRYEAQQLPRTLAALWGRQWADTLTLLRRTEHLSYPQGQYLVRITRQLRRPPDTGHAAIQAIDAIASSDLAPTITIAHVLGRRTPGINKTQGIWLDRALTLATAALLAPQQLVVQPPTTQNATINITAILNGTDGKVLTDDP